MIVDYSINIFLVIDFFSMEWVSMINLFSWLIFQSPNQATNFFYCSLNVFDNGSLSTVDPMTKKNWLLLQKNSTFPQNKFGHMISNGSISSIDLILNLDFFFVIIRLQWLNVVSITVRCRAIKWYKYQLP